jgi:hypothetical protein
MNWRARAVHVDEAAAKPAASWRDRAEPLKLPPNLTPEQSDYAKEAGGVGSFIRGAMQGASLDFADEMQEKVEDGLERLGVERPALSPKEKMAALKAESPNAYGAGEFVGSMLPISRMPGAVKGAGRLEKVAHSAQQGMLLGGIRAGGRHEGDLEGPDAGKHILEGALGGGILSGAVSGGVNAGAAAGAAAGMVKRGAGKSGEALAAHSRALRAEKQIDALAPAKAKAEEAQAVIKAIRSDLNKKGIDYRDAHKLTPQIEKALAAMNRAEKRGAELVLKQQEAVRRGAQEDLDKILIQQSQNNKAWEAAEKARDALKVLRKRDPGWYKINRAKYDAGQELERGRSAVDAIRAKEAGLGADAAAARAVPGAGALGRFAKTLNPRRPADYLAAPIVAVPRAILGSPERSQAVADRLLGLSRASSTLQGYMPALTAGTELMGKAAGQEIVQRHIDLMKTDSGYRSEVEMLELLDDIEGGNL